MAKHVVWVGPVSAAQRAGATVVGAAEHFLTCTGSECRAKAEAFGSQDGRHLPALLHQLGIDEAEPDLEIYLGAFSAGGSMVKVLLRHADDRALVRGVLLADATYELAGPDGRPAASPSLVDYAAEAVGGDRFFLATASANKNNYNGTAEPSGADTMQRVVQDLEARLGRSPTTSNFIDADHLDDVQQAQHVWTFARNVQLIDFGSAYVHEQHATKLAPRLWPALLQPWIDGRAHSAQPHHPLPDQPAPAGSAQPAEQPAAAPASGDGDSSSAGLALGLLAVVSAIALVAAVSRRSRVAHL